MIGKNKQFITYVQCSAGVHARQWARGHEGLRLIVGRNKKLCPSPKHPESLWAPPSLMLKRYRGLFLWV